VTTGAIAMHTHTSAATTAAAMIASFHVNREAGSERAMAADCTRNRLVRVFSSP
jgi:hypothetical protein